MYICLYIYICLFGCGSFIQEDSIEHYASCAVCLHFLKHKLHFHGRVDRGHLVAMVANSGAQKDEEEDVCRLAMWCFVLYKTFDKLRSGLTTASGLRIPCI